MPLPIAAASTLYKKTAAKQQKGRQTGTPARYFGFVAYRQFFIKYQLYPQWII